MATDRVQMAYELIDNKTIETDSPSLLAVGCGAGEGLEYFSNKGYQTFGIDVSDSHIERLYKEEKTVALGSATNIPFQSSQFDIVLFLEVIEHLPEGTEDEALDEIKRVLKKGGNLILSTPNKGTLQKLDSSNILPKLAQFPIIRGYIKHIYSDQKLSELSSRAHHRHYSRTELRELLKSTGFLIRDINYRKTGLSEISSILVPFDKFTSFRRKVHSVDYMISIGEYSYHIMILATEQD